jgi:isomaltose glucohydrolase
MRATLRCITRDLVVDGGVHRYSEDEYYGGGLWVVLAGALGDVLRRQGDDSGWQRTLAWIESTADADGHLAEQVPLSLRHPELRQPWIDRWGEVARPLHWSHAMYIIAKTTGPTTAVRGSGA